MPQSFMACDQEASSSNSSNSNSTRKTWKYDIFLSFSGEDTRRGFTNYLYSVLKRSGFRVFRDDEELRRGEVISQELLQAIEESRFAIVILSRNYASSSWCLDELQHILYSRDNLCQLVFPIFYHVDPSDVRKQRKRFGKAFAKLEHKFQQDQPKVQKWRDSLTQVANLSGFDSTQSGYEAELLEDVVEHLWNQLHPQSPPVSESDGLIGIEWRVDEMLKLLGIGSDDVRFIGVWGMGGVGKTTLSRALYERFHHQFDFHYFLANVREVSERHGLVYLQNKLFSQFKIRNSHIEDKHEGKNTFRYLFRNRKVMLILDDVNHISQLQNLAASHEWFGDGSRIIITTRDVHLLKSHGVDEIHEVLPMDNTESLQLFCQKAFKKRVVPADEQYQQLALSAINYTRGLPLALCVLGSFFCGRDGLTEWQDALDMLRQDSNNDIFKTLKMSYCELDLSEKKIFLDIACFFSMWGKDEIIQILESCGLHARTGLRTLLEKSLLDEFEIGGTTYIDMHDLLQDMGKVIVSEESPNLGRRTRLWLPNDIDALLERRTGTKQTEGVVLPHSFEKDEVCWNPEAFIKMYWLRLLIISCKFDLRLHLKSLPGSLKVLHWYGYPIEALPSKEHMNQLVYLKMQNSKIKRLSDDEQPMKNLKILDLSYSRNLLQTPNFFGFQNLKRLVLEGCTSLVEIHSSLGQLHCLVEVNLKGCLNLKVLPKKLEMNYLEKLVLSGCIKVRNLPEFGEKMENLIILDVEETSMEKLPESLGFLTSIETLDLKSCENLVGLPHNIHKLKCLKVLDISGCSNFSELPENLNENEALEKLDASGTAIAEVPSSICYLKQLKTLAFHRCKRPTANSSILSLLWNQMSQRNSSLKKALTFPASIFNIESLTELDLSYCSIVDGVIPDDLNGLSSLQRLDLSGNEFVNLPRGCISNLLNLRSLYLNSCTKLELLPQPSPGLNLMDAGECGSLRTLSDKELLHLFASMELDGQHAEELRRNIRTLSVTVPGSEIPSWFENQNHLPLNQKHVASVTIDIPVGQWLGIGLCTVIDDKICSPRWGFDLKASDGKYVSLPGRTREHEKEIISCHLWIVFWKIKEENRDELSRNSRQIRLKFCTDWEQPPSIKCGWRFIPKGGLELPKNSGLRQEFKGYTWCSEAEEQEKWSLLPINEKSQIINDRCEAMSQASSSLSLEEEDKLEDSQMQFITHCARHHNFSTSTANPAITESPSSSNCCHFEKEATILSDYSINGTQDPASNQISSGEGNHDAGDTLAPSIASNASMLCSKQTSAEEILKELSQVPDLTETELVQIYVILTGNEREYESFKALPTPLLRKLWISTQIKRNYS